MNGKILAFTYKGSEAFVTIKAGTVTRPFLLLSIECGNELCAELTSKQLASVFGDAIEADRVDQYQDGYRDGMRDARSHRPASKRTWWSRAF